MRTTISFVGISKFLAVALALLLASCSGGGGGGGAGSPENPGGPSVVSPDPATAVVINGFTSAPNLLLVRFTTGATEEDMAEVIADAGGKIVGSVPLTMLVQAQFDGAWTEARANQLMDQLNAVAIVRGAYLQTLLVAQSVPCPDNSPGTLCPDDPWSSNPTGKLNWDSDLTTGFEWRLEAMGLNKAWALVYDPTRAIDHVAMGVIDQRFASGHEDFQKKEDQTAILEILNFPEIGPTDDFSHGMHVAGIMAAVGDNSRGIAGIAWKDSSVFAWDDRDTRFDSVNNGFWNVRVEVGLAKLLNTRPAVRVINLSAGSCYTPGKTGCDTMPSTEPEKTNRRKYLREQALTMFEAFHLADKDVLWVQAAGNEGKNPGIDASFSGYAASALWHSDDNDLDELKSRHPHLKEIRSRLLVVGATYPKTTTTTDIASYVNKDSDGSDAVVQVYAPGGEAKRDATGFCSIDAISDCPCLAKNRCSILSTGRSFYFEAIGTSMAAPHVSGLAGLLWQVNRGFTAEGIKNLILLRRLDETPILDIGGAPLRDARMLARGVAADAGASAQEAILASKSLAPIASFNCSQSGSGLSCDATSSTDASGVRKTMAQYNWVLLDAQGTTMATQLGSSSPIWSVCAPKAGTYAVTLRVFDANGFTSQTAEQTVNVATFAACSSQDVGSVSPTVMTANGIPQTLTINGSGFRLGDFVQFKWSVGPGSGVWTDSIGAIKIPDPSRITVPVNPGTVAATINVRVCRSSFLILSVCSSGTAAVTVVLPVAALTVTAVTCSAPIVGLVMTCTVTGTNLPANGMSMTATDCSPSDMVQQAGGSDTRRTFTCTPVAVGTVAITGLVVPGFVGALPVLPSGVAVLVPTYSIGGTITGLAGTGLVLRNNGGNDLSIPASARSFAFVARIPGGGGYNVTVLTQPSNPTQTCAVSNGAGTVGSTDISAVAIRCSTNTYAIGGNVSGLAPGSSLILRNNGADDLKLSANGPFTFASRVASGEGYDVTIATLPADQPCTRTYGAATVAGANVTNVNVFCGPAARGGFVPGPSLAAGRFGHTATLLASGKVLVAGGKGDVTDASLASAELYDPLTDTWSAAGSLAGPRAFHSATLLPNGKVLVAGGFNNVGILDILASAELYDPATNTWSATGTLAIARFSHTAVLLASGKVLVAGGHDIFAVALASAELYDPATNTWSATGSLAIARGGHTANLLPNGRVLVAGGDDTAAPPASAELYDPATNTWSAAGSLAIGRYSHTATLLPNGKVLVAGGTSTNFTKLTSAELYDSATNTWSTAASLTRARSGHTASLLLSGKVLVAGIFDFVDDAELYEPMTNTWSTAGSLKNARVDHSATLLPSGKVLVAGGNGGGAKAELYDPAANIWSPTSSLTGPRSLHTATLLPSGKVLVAGGLNGPNNTIATAIASAELYDPTTETWSAAGSLLSARVDYTATLLSNGKVLVVGGINRFLLGGAELYDPATDTWSAARNLGTARSLHTATLLPSGKVLVAGGFEGGFTALASAELYDPTTDTWSTAGNLSGARFDHTATLLPNGKVLVAGGSSFATLASAELYDPATNTWSAAGNLTGTRSLHTATLLPTGKVLVAGGFDGSVAPTGAELYDPATNTWSAAGSLAGARTNHTAALLPSGKVLVVGGLLTGVAILASSELYDPATNTWSAAGSLANERYSHSATLLPSGKLLVTGGTGNAGDLATTELCW